ncbi:MAG: fibronectin type III domain-containing protein [Dysgonamonadaceae bacterium]|jgi:hypothetical protein|nr:fibronectin type III domain-containing protein [Dysgonamonadaceae bacterium]
MKKTGFLLFLCIAGLIKTNAQIEIPALNIVESGFTRLKLEAVANTAGDSVIIAINMGQWAVDNNNNQLNDGIFGTPDVTANAGSNIAGGGKVIYRGIASGNIEVNGLPSGKLINFAAWSYSGTMLSAVVKKNITTWGTMPYLLNPASYSPFELPESWDGENGLFELTRNATDRRGGVLQARTTTASPNEAVYGSAATQYLQLAQQCRFILAGTLTHTTSSRPYITTGYVGGTEGTVWEEKDSLVVWIKKYGETDYAQVFTINKANAGNFFTDVTAGTFNLKIPIEGFGGDTVKVKLAWTVHKAGTMELNINRFLIEEMPEYEYPINLTVEQASIVASQAKVSWTKHPDGTESAWEIRYRAIDGEWTLPVEVDTTSYLFTTLPTDATVDVQVRAKISSMTYSTWSLPLSFKTGYGLPYNEDFNAYTAATFSLNSGWTLTNSNMILWNSGTLRLRPYLNPAPASAYAWLPKLDYGDGSVNYKLAFDIMLSGTMPESDSLFVVIKTENEDVVLQKYPAIPESGRDTIELTGLSGIRQVGFKMVENERNTSAYFAIDNLQILPNCPAKASNIQANDIIGTEATIAWEGDADEWLIFLRKAGDTGKDYALWQRNDTTFTGLDVATTYEIGITHSCAPGDTAKVSIITFTTLAVDPCYPVTEIAAEATTESITIVWESTATSFNVKFHKKSVNDWIERHVTEKTATFNGLTHNTEYEYTIQAICSAAEGDVSEWSEIAQIRTVEITCFAPNNIVADPLGYKSATLQWEGDADKYEILWELASSSGLTSEIITGKSLALDNLTPETEYQLKIRSICAEGDTSVYSPVYKFTTGRVPDCPVPTGLQVRAITSASAMLVWTADAANTSWDLSYRDGGVYSWTNVNGLAEATYTLEELTPNTVYLWRVKAHCAVTENESVFASVEEFTTSGAGIDLINSGKLNISVSSRIISILNHGKTFIKNVYLYDINGILLKSYSINASDNVLIPTTLNQKAAIIKVTGNDTQATFKAIVK